jgi:hypothetical protein
LRLDSGDDVAKPPENTASTLPLLIIALIAVPLPPLPTSVVPFAVPPDNIH